MNQEEEKKNKSFAVFIFFIVILILSVILIARYVGTKGLKVKEYRIESSELPINFSGLKMVHFSDLFLKNTTDISDVEEMVERINILKPDLVVFTGDLIGKGIKLTEKEKNGLIKILSNISNTTGKYAVKGDNDYSNEEFENIITSSGFILLENSFDLIYYDGLTPIFIGGVSSASKREIDLSSTFEYFNTDEELYIAKYKIILTHEGDASSQIVEYDPFVNLILSGNSLNGSVIIPFYGQLFIPKGSKKYYAPYYKINNTDLYISSGIGTNNYKFRLLNKPSFNFYRFKSL